MPSSSSSSSWKLTTTREMFRPPCFVASVGVLVVVVGGGCQKESRTKALFGRQQLSLNSPIHPRLSWFWLGVSWRSGYCRVTSEKHPQSVWRGSWWRLVCDGLGCWIERSFPLMYQRNSLLRFCVAPPTILLMLIMPRLWTIARILGTRQRTTKDDSSSLSSVLSKSNSSRAVGFWSKSVRSLGGASKIACFLVSFTSGSKRTKTFLGRILLGHSFRVFLALSSW